MGEPGRGGKEGYAARRDRGGAAGWGAGAGVTCAAPRCARPKGLRTRGAGTSGSPPPPPGSPPRPRVPATGSHAPAARARSARPRRLQPHLGAPPGGGVTAGCHGDAAARWGMGGPAGGAAGAGRGAPWPPRLHARARSLPRGFRSRVGSPAGGLPGTTF